MRRRRRRRNPGHVLRDSAVIVGSGIVAGFVGRALGTAVTGSELSAPPYAFAGTLAGATVAHFFLR